MEQLIDELYLDPEEILDCEITDQSWTSLHVLGSRGIKSHIHQNK